MYPKLHDLVVQMQTTSGSGNEAWINFCITITLSFAFFLLVWLLHNVWKILIKQCRLKVLPLTTFYILAIMIVIAHSYYAIELGSIILYSWVLPQVMCQILMFGLTLQQTWVVIELCLVIMHIRKQMSGGNPVFPQTFIKWARVIVTLLVATWVVVLFVHFSKNDDLGFLLRYAFLYNVLSFYVPIFQGVAIFLMTTTITILFIQLHKLKPFLVG